MKSVFIVQHLHTLPHGEEDVKIIGVYESLSTAHAALERARKQQGFREFPKLIDPETDDDPQGFYVDEYCLDMDHWEEGFVNV